MTDTPKKFVNAKGREGSLKSLMVVDRERSQAEVVVHQPTPTHAKGSSVWRTTEKQFTKEEQWKRELANALDARRCTTPEERGGKGRVG